MKLVARAFSYFLVGMCGALFAPTIQTVAGSFVGFEITDRAILDFGVPFIRSGPEYGNDKPTALDVGPRGNPTDRKGSGKAWIDVCNADLIGDPTAQVSCFYAGAYSDHIAFGSRSFNDAPVKPLQLRIGRTTVGELTENGLVIHGTVTATGFVKSQ